MNNNEKIQADKLGYLITAAISNTKILGEKQTLLALKEYINNGNPKGFTRQDGARDNLMKVLPQEIHQLLNGKSLEEFMSWIKAHIEHEEIKVDQGTVARYNYVIEKVIQTLETTYLKYCQSYPVEQVKKSLVAQIKNIINHNYSCITRDNNARATIEEALSNLSSETIYQALQFYLHEWGYEVNTMEQLSVALVDFVDTKNNFKEQERQK